MNEININTIRFRAMYKKTYTYALRRLGKAGRNLKREVIKAIIDLIPKGKDAE